MKLSNNQINEIKERRKKGEKVRDIAKIMNVSPATISYWIDDKRRKKKNLDDMRRFKNKSLGEKSEIYKKRLPYLRNYQKKKYNEDEQFREEKKLKSKYDWIVKKERKG